MWWDVSFEQQLQTVQSILSKRAPHLRALLLFFFFLEMVFFLQKILQPGKVLWRGEIRQCRSELRHIVVISSQRFFSWTAPITASGLQGAQLFCPHSFVGKECRHIKSTTSEEGLRMRVHRFRHTCLNNHVTVNARRDETHQLGGGFHLFMFSNVPWFLQGFVKKSVERWLVCKVWVGLGTARPVVPEGERPRRFQGEIWYFFRGWFFAYGNAFLSGLFCCDHVFSEVFSDGIQRRNVYIFGHVRSRRIFEREDHMCSAFFRPQRLWTSHFLIILSCSFSTWLHVSVLISIATHKRHAESVHTSHHQYEYKVKDYQRKSARDSYIQRVWQWAISIVCTN